MSGQIKRHYFETSGFSMWPFLKQKDRIIAEDVPVGELKPGDIILYKVNGQLTCHRLVKKEKSSKGYILFTRGDYAPFWSTDKVLAEEVLGRVSGIVRSDKLISLRGLEYVLGSRCIIIFFPLVVFLFTRISKLCKNDE